MDGGLQATTTMETILAVLAERTAAAERWTKPTQSTIYIQQKNE